MSNTPSPREDDPWEELAENLFGLEFGKEHASTESSTPPAEPVASSSETPHSPPPAPPAEAVPVAVAPVAVAAPSVMPVVESITPPPAEAPTPTPEVAPHTPVKPQDSYWDALANWNWDVESSGSRSRSAPPPQQSRQEVSQRAEESRSHDVQKLSPASQGAAAPERGGRSSPPGADVSGDFGAGALDDRYDRAKSTSSPPSQSPSSSAGSVDDDADDDFGDLSEANDDEGTEEGGEEAPGAAGEGDQPRKRRRRRRRRSKNGKPEQQPANAPAGRRNDAAPAEIPGSDWDESSAAATAPPTVESPRRAPAEPSRPQTRAEAPRTDSQERRGGQSRRGERRGSHQPPAQAPAAEEVVDEFSTGFSESDITTSGGDVGMSFESGDDGDDSGEPRVSYDDVPTWEEAISFLLHPNQVRVESGGGSGSGRGAPPPTDQPRQTRHYGGRR
ncbi:MAG: hypothetical protein ACKV0T_16275 [Planctomycetales bacterium]